MYLSESRFAHSTHIRAQPVRLCRDGQANLLRVFKDLSGYANGIEPVDERNPDLLRSVADLRDILELLYGQHITFKGEDRPPSSTVLTGSVRAGAVKGVVTGVELQGEFKGEATGHVQADSVESGGTATGVKWRGR